MSLRNQNGILEIQCFARRNLFADIRRIEQDHIAYLLTLRIDYFEFASLVQPERCARLFRYGVNHHAVLNGGEKGISNVRRPSDRCIVELPTLRHGRSASG